MKLFRCWTSRSAVVLLIGVATVTTHGRQARAQACCASAGLVAPTRLRSYEDFAVGAQGRVRSGFGAFDAFGNYAGAAAGESEWNLEQDLFAVARVFERGQVSLLLPFIETRRSVPGLGASGGGIGDVAINARYDFIASGERRVIPGVAVLLGVLLPTGRAPEDAADTPLAAGATGQGSAEVSVGAAVEQAFDPYFITVNALCAFRRGRTVMGIGESFAPRWTGIAAVGRVLPRHTTAGIFASVMRQGDNSDDTGPIAGSASSLLSAGLAGTVSPTDAWRVQGTLSTNVPVAGWGRNQTAGVSAGLSLVRLWM